MKRLFLILALLAPTIATAEQQILATVTLQPRESKEVVVESTVKVKLGWDHTDDDAAGRCKKNCINMVRSDGMEMASMHGGSMGVRPIDGKVTMAFQNVESFPIEIVIWRK